jgi:hypothetical protein
MFNRSLRIALFLVLPVFAATALLMPSEDALAQAKKPTNLSDEQLAASIHKLRSVKLTLEAADHDYGGHRAAAVEKVKAATHELHKALEYVRKGKTVPKNTTKDVGSSNEPQKLSDAQLAATIPVLKNTHKVLQQGDLDYGGHRAKAVTELGAAITQLEKALAYIKTKE